MDRLAAHIVATAVLTAALAAIPTAVAQPAPTSSKPAAAAAPTPSPSHHDLVPFPCPDAVKVGRTAYARWHGAIAFSVTQFYSAKCHSRYGFAYAWLQFRVKRVTYDLNLGEYDVTHDAIDGARTFKGGAGGPYFWSGAVTVPAGTCTQGLAHVFFPDNETDTFSGKFCR